MLKLAQDGDAEAQYRTGVFFDRGEYVARNQGEATKWYRKAAEQGHTDAQTALATIYFNGYQTIKRDYAEALKWGQLSALQGDENGAFILGYIFYSGGDAVAKNLVSAYAWFSQVTRYSEPRVAEIAGQLTSDQLRQAQQEALNLKEKINSNKTAEL